MPLVLRLSQAAKPCSQVIPWICFGVAEASDSTAFNGHMFLDGAGDENPPLVQCCALVKGKRTVAEPRTMDPNWTRHLHRGPLSDSLVVTVTAWLPTYDWGGPTSTRIVGSGQAVLPENIRTLNNPKQLFAQQRKGGLIF